MRMQILLQGINVEEMERAKMWMIRYLVLVSFVGLLLFTADSFAGVDVKVNQDIDALLQNETSITLNPAVPGNIVVAYNEDPGSGLGLGISYSFDGGLTWGDTQTPSFWGQECDPSVAADTRGNIFAGMLSYSGSFFYGNSGIYVLCSSDSGQTWPVSCNVGVHSYPGTGPPVPFVDKPYLAVDTYSGSPYVDNVYIAWQQEDANGNTEIYFSRSTDNGITFSTPQKISDLPTNQSLAQAPVPAVAPNGDVYVVWLDAWISGNVPGSLFVDKSTDGGQTFGTDVLACNILTVPRYPNGGNSFKVYSYPSIAVNPQNSNDVYVVFAADPDGTSGPDEGDIFFISSNDGGSTWSAILRVNDDGTATGQYQPWIAVKPDGTIDIVWYDYRNDLTQWWLDVYITTSFDGGLGFQPNWQINDSSFQIYSPQLWMGEYIGLTVDSTHAYAVWTDTRLNDRDIFFDVIANPTGVEEASAVRLPQTFSLAQNYPNPFNPLTTIDFSLPKKEHVNIKIYNINGQEIITLLDKKKSAGNNSVIWNGKNHAGYSVPSGIYFYQIKAGDFIQTLKMSLIR